MPKEDRENGFHAVGKQLWINLNRISTGRNSQCCPHMHKKKPSFDQLEIVVRELLTEPGQNKCFVVTAP